MKQETFGKRLKRLRIENNLSQDEVAKELHVSGSAIGMYERDEREPDISKLIQLAQIFHISLGYMITGEHDSIEPFIQQFLDKMFSNQTIKRFFFELNLATENEIDKIIQIWDIVKGKDYMNQ